MARLPPPLKGFVYEEARRSLAFRGLGGPFLSIPW